MHALNLMIEMTIYVNVKHIVGGLAQKVNSCSKFASVSRPEYLHGTSENHENFNEPA